MRELDPRPKLLAVLLLTTMAMLFSRSLWLLGLCAVALLLAAAMGADLPGFLRKLRHFLGMLLFVVLLQCIFTRRGEPLLTVFGFTLVTTGGAAAAGGMAMRFFIVLCSISVMAAESTRRVTAALIALRLPYTLVFMLMTALRFLPLFSESFRDAFTAIQLRGIELKRLPLRKFIALCAHLLLPVTADAIVRSQSLALAMEARGFGAYKRRTQYYVVTLSRPDWLATILTVLAGGLAFLAYYML